MLGDLLGPLEGGVHDEVVGDEKVPNPDAAGTGGRVGLGGPDIWEEVLEGTATHLWEGSLDSVVKAGDPEAGKGAGESLASLECEGEAPGLPVGHKRHEGDDVDDTKTGMHSGVAPEIEQLERPSPERQGRLLDVGLVTDEGEDAPVVEGVAVNVDYSRSRRRSDLPHKVEVAAFGDVDYRFEGVANPMGRLLKWE